MNVVGFVYRNKQWGYRDGSQKNVSLPISYTHKNYAILSDNALNYSGITKDFQSFKIYGSAWGNAAGQPYHWFTIG